MNARKQKQTMADASLPPELAGRLRAMIRRVRRILFLRGVLFIASVLVACTLAIMAVDAAVLIYASSVRWALSVAGLTATLATAWYALVRPLTRRLTLLSMARVLETRHPELQERISSAIELTAMRASRESEQLIALLAQEAQTDVQGLQPRREFPGRSLKPALLAALTAGGVLTALFTIWPRQTGLLCLRAWKPYANFATLQGANLVVDPGDAVRLQGGEMAIRLRVKNGASVRAELRRVMAAGTETVERMRRISPDGAGEDAHEFSFPSVRETFRYRIRYGTGLTRYYNVTVLPPPAMTRLAIVCHDPAYTGRPPRTLPDTNHSITGVVGTRVEMAADFNRAADATLELGGRGMPGATTKTPGATWNFVLATNMTGRWSLRLRDCHGFTNRVEASVMVLPDRAPVIVMTSPRQEQLTLPPYGKITFSWEISEDFGLTQSEFCVACNSGSAVFTNIAGLALQKQGPETWTGARELDLARMQMDGVRQMRVWLRVADTRPPELGGPQVAQSRVVQIDMAANARRIEDQLRAEQKNVLQGLLQAAAARLVQGAGLVAPVQAQTSVNPPKPAVLQALVAAQEHAVAAVARLQQAGGLCGRSVFASLTTTITEVNNQAVEPARAAVADILLAQAVQRPEASGMAVRALRDAAARVQELAAALEARDRTLATIAKNDELAQREQALAEQAGARKMTRMELAAWHREQARISQGLAAQTPKNTAESMVFEKAADNMGAAQKEMEPERPAMPDDPTVAVSENAKAAAQAAQTAARHLSKLAGLQAKAAGENVPSAQDWRADEAVTATENQSRNDTMNPGRRDFTPVFLSAPDATGAAWLRYKNRANSEALEGVLKNVPPEYRDLARRYFEELAREGGKDREVTP